MLKTLSRSNKNKGNLKNRNHADSKTKKTDKTILFFENGDVSRGTRSVFLETKTALLRRRRPDDNNSGEQVVNVSGDGIGKREKSF